MLTQIISESDHNAIVAHIGTSIAVPSLSGESSGVVYSENTIKRIEARGINLDTMCQALFGQDGYEYFSELVPFRINDVVDESYLGQPFNLIDFTLHLKADVALYKRLSRRQSDYRPEYAYYYLGSDDYARRRFDFTLGANGLVERRCEFLAYYKADGSIGEEFKIKDKTFDHTDVDELAEAILEQTKLRNDIVQHIKSTIMGVITVLNPTFDIHQIIAATLPFFNELTTERLDYIEIGSSDYYDAVLAIDLATTTHTYLAAPVAPGVTLRDYILGRL